MKTLIFLLCCLLIVTNGQDSSVIIIGSKFIRPKQPYIVAFTNPLNSNVKLKLSIGCDDENGFQQTTTLQLNRHAEKTYKFNVPDITGDPNELQCFFSAENDGGEIQVNHETQLVFPDKTLSVFILTDKPIYKPGDIVRFRVVVVDIALKPVKHIESVEIHLIEVFEKSMRQWKKAELYKGIFESSYQLPSVPALGMWTLTVSATDNSVVNKKSQQFEVREYVLPKFVIHVEPARTLLIAEQQVILNVTAHYTFGGPVRGQIQVEIFAEAESDKKASNTERRHFDGSGLFSSHLAKKLVPSEEEGYAFVVANVSLTEEFSNFTANVIRKIPVFLHRNKITLIKSSMYFRPGAGYFCKLSVKDHTGAPLATRTRTVKLKTDFSRKEVVAELDKQGIASFVFSVPNGIQNVKLSAVFEGVTYDGIGEISALETAPSQHVHVNTKQRIIVGRSVSFNINSNEPFTQLSYFVTSRGSVVTVGHQKLNRGKKSHQIKLKLTPEMAPHAVLFVYITKDNQMIVDFIELDFESFGNEFEFMLNEEAYKPNDEMTVDLRAEEDSYVAFHAIDQGALLLGYDDFGLSKKRVLEDLEEYTRKESAESSFDLVESFGLFLHSNLEDIHVGSSRMRRSLARSRTYKAPVFLRTSFPEAWLWSNFTMNSNPTQTITAIVPDTITSWQVTGFALSPSRGLGLMGEPRKFTVGKPFYMIANLPYSIKRGEVAVVQITIFSFLEETLPTEVTLFNKNEEIEFMDRRSSDPKYHQKSVIVHSHRAQPISFLIKAKKLGEIFIKIEAENARASDGLERMLRVTPESHRHQRTESRFINLPTHGSQTFNIDCVIPKTSDPGSTKIHLIIDPPTVATTIHNLDSLFAIPTGAANLNLLTFIPNVIVLDYLKETSTPTPLLEQKAIDYLSSGYQNQLKYKQSNGAFTQWNNKNEKPSVFLTALVANAFKTASNHIRIDNEVIVRAFSWIAEMQKSDGCFVDDSEVIYAPLQGNSSSIALTAFVVAAVKENKNIGGQFGELVAKGVDCLARNFDSLDRTHDIALATYALVLARHSRWEHCLDRLLRDSVKNDAGRYWNQEMNVEIAGYALLTYLSLNNYLDALPIMQWLNSQRYSTGRFAGVHSTFVALKALGKMATYITRTRNNYKAQIKYLQNQTTFDLMELRSMDYIKQELPDHARKFEIKINGIGFGLLQVTYQYHLNIQLAKPRFNLDVQLLESSTYDIQNLQVCLSYTPKESYAVSGLALVEVFLPSGLMVNKNAVRDLSKKVKKTEPAHSHTAMFVYYSGLDANEVCFEVTAYRKFKIAMHRPAHVIVYDTEDTESFAIKSYEGKVLHVCDICDDEGCKSMNC